MGAWLVGWSVGRCFLASLPVPGWSVRDWLVSILNVSFHCNPFDSILYMPRTPHPAPSVIIRYVETWNGTRMSHTTCPQRDVPQVAGLISVESLVPQKHDETYNLYRSSLHYARFMYRTQIHGADTSSAGCCCRIHWSSCGWATLQGAKNGNALASIDHSKGQSEVTRHTIYGVCVCSCPSKCVDVPASGSCGMLRFMHP